MNMRETFLVNANRRPKISWMFAVIAAVSFVAIVASLTAVARGATAANLRVVHLGEDAFFNYDFLPKPPLDDPFGPFPPTSPNYRAVDWPITTIFWCDASRVELALGEFGSRYPASGRTEYGRTNDGSGWQWKGDAGLKTSRCPASTGSQNVVHLRAYGNSDNSSLYNLSWGFYLVPPLT